MSFPRYPAYKDSGVEWLGEVPQHWDVTRLRFASDINPSKSELNGTSKDSVISFLPMEAIGEDGRLCLDRTKKLEDVETGYTYFRDGDVVVAKITPCFENGKGALISGLLGGAGFGTTELIVARPRDGVIHPRLLDYIFRSHTFRRLGESSMYGAGGQKRVPEAFVKDFAVGLPSAFSEQALIATFLDHETAKIDDLIAEQQRLIELLQEKRQAVISHAVTKGLNPDAPIKDSGVEWLGEVPEHWEVCPVKFLARIGNGSTPNRDNSDYWTDVGFPWLNSSVVNQAEVSEAERFVTQLALKECHLPIIEPPAVLVGITGQGKTRGMAAPLRFVATVNQHVAYIKPDVERLGIDYLQRALEAAYEHLRTESEGVGSTKGAITCEQLGAWKLPIPHLREQEAIVSYLNEEAARLDSLKGESDRAIGLLQERRSALISAAVTGRIDVRGLVPAEAAA